MSSNKSSTRRSALLLTVSCRSSVPLPANCGWCSATAAARMTNECTNATQSAYGKRCGATCARSTMARSNPKVIGAARITASMLLQRETTLTGKRHQQATLTLSPARAECRRPVRTRCPPCGRRACAARSSRRSSSTVARWPWRRRSTRPKRTAPTSPTACTRPAACDLQSSSNVLS